MLQIKVDVHIIYVSIRNKWHQCMVTAITIVCLLHGISGTFHSKFALSWPFKSRISNIS